jgi:hypothetical protein
LNSKAAVNDWLRYDLTENLSVDIFGWKKIYFRKLAILYKFWLKVLEVEKFEPVIVSDFSTEEKYFGRANVFF